MATPSLLQTLVSYVPPLVTRRFVTKPEPIYMPYQERFPAAVLFTDISGFTSLTERLAQRGPAGVEELSRVLNTYFSELINLLSQHGGQVIKFAGDAAIVVWHALETSEPLDTLTQRAAQCGLALQTALNNYEVADNLRLSMKVSLAVGDVWAASVGGMYNRWEYVVAGEPLSQIAIAEKQAQPGEVIIAPQTWPRLRPHATGQTVGKDCVRLETLHKPPPPRPLDDLAPPMQAAAALRAYVPAAILQRMDAGQHHWLAELRRITVMFINITGLDYAAPNALEKIQRVAHAMQTILYRYEGSVNQLVVDDKGTTLLTAFGLPPLAHEEDEKRSILTALAMETRLHGLGLGSSIGIATGRIFCGERGSDQRREYALQGDTVNLAARLMQAAARQKVGILCDHATYDAAKKRLAFDILPPIQLKGKAQPAPVFHPLGEAAPAPPAPQTTAPQTPLVERKKEYSLLTESLQALQQNESNAFIIEGEAGIGKSHLMHALQAQAHTQGVKILLGEGEAVEKKTPYYVWRKIFAGLFNFDPAIPIAQHQQKLTAELPQAPLLNAVLPFNLPDNERTAQMIGEVRAANTQQLIIELLQETVQKTPTLLILEDAHWIDPASWALARLIMRNVHPLLMIVATRTMGKEPLAEYVQLKNTPGTRHILLGSLPTPAIKSLLRQRLGVKKLPASVVAFIQEKAEGHPLFTEEMAYALRDAGYLISQHDECHLAPDVDLHSLPFSDTVQDIVMRRIDRLSPQEQLTLKTASVIGHAFTFRTLQDIYPIETDKPYLNTYLENLAQRRLIVEESPAPNLVYTFRNLITQEVTYNLMAFSQRQELHYAAAEWHEKNFGHLKHLQRHFYPTLAHHWQQAGETEKAIDYYVKAGEQALQDGAYQEAVDLLREVLAMTTEQPDSGLQASKLEQARWRRLLGHAYFGMGRLTKSHRTLEQAITLLDYPVPRTKALIFGSPRWALRVLWFAARPPKRQKAAPQQKAAQLHEAVLIYNYLAQIHLVTNEIGPMIFAALKTFDLALKIGPSPALARACGTQAAFYTFLRLHSAAKVFAQWGQDLAQEFNDLPALAWTLYAPAIWGFGFAPWDELYLALERVRKIYMQLGDTRNVGDSLAFIGFLRYFQGHFAEGVTVYAEVHQAGAKTENLEHQVFGLNGHAMCLLAQGQTEQALTFLEKAAILLSRIPQDRITNALNAGLRATALLRLQNADAARQAAETGLNLLENTLSATNAIVCAYTGPAEVYLALWETEIGRLSTDLPKKPPSGRIVHSTKQACKLLTRFARMYPNGQPAARRYEGLYFWLAGRRKKAQKRWQKSLAAAQRLDMPYEEGLTHYEIARRLPVESAERQTHLTKAAAIFERLGAAHDLARARKALVTPNESSV